MDAQKVYGRLLPPPKREVLTPEKALRLLEVALEKERSIKPSVLEAIGAGVRDDDPRLLQLLAGRLDQLGDEPRLRKVRKALRKRAAASPAQAPSPTPWAGRARTEGWRVVLLGGDRPRKMVPLLKDAFGFSEVRWESGHKMRRVRQLQGSVRSGRVDLCLVVARFLSHKASNLVVDACKERGVPVVTMGSGAGLEALKQELESRLGIEAEEGGSQ